MNRTYQELFNLSDELFTLSEHAFDLFNRRAEKFPLNKIPRHKAISLFFLNRGRQDFNSIRILCSSEMGDSATILLRSIFENLISLRYILAAGTNTERDQLAQRFIDYEIIDKAKQLTYWEDHAHNKDLKASILSQKKEIVRRCDEFSKKYKIKEPLKSPSWSGKNIRIMAKDVEAEGDYLLTYKMCCWYSHPSFIGARQSTFRHETGTTFSLQSDSNTIITVLQSSIAYHSQLTFIFDLLFKLGLKIQLSSFQEKALEKFNQNAH